MVFALLPFCPLVLLPICPFALTPLPLPPSWFFCSFKFWRLSREDIVCICFHISVHVQISSTLLMLLLSAQMTTKIFISRRQTKSMPFLAAIIEALSKHLKAWRGAWSRCRTSWDLRIRIINAKCCLFCIERTKRSTCLDRWLTWSWRCVTLRT